MERLYSGSVGVDRMPDLNHSILAHNAIIKIWWQDPVYIRERIAFVKRNPICSRCGRPTVTPGHSPEDYQSFERYLDAVVTDKCEPLCSGCNLMEKKGFHPCPGCVEKHPGEKPNYIPEQVELCRDCRDPKELELQKKENERWEEVVRQCQIRFCCVRGTFKFQRDRVASRDFWKIGCDVK